jgi:hypothetical protein
LPSGVDYHYTLRAVLIRDGQTLVKEQVVKVRAGEDTRVTIELPPTSVAQR